MGVYSVSGRYVWIYGWSCLDWLSSQCISSCAATWIGWCSAINTTVWPALRNPTSNYPVYNFDFVGSIITDGTDPSIAPFVDIQHEGHPGWTASQISIGTYGWLNSNPADIILLHAGTNELVSTDETHIEAILDEIDLWESNNGNPVTVLLALIIDRDSKNDATVAAFNTAVYNMAQTRITGGDDIIIVDQQAAVDYEADMSDNLHPNADGYINMADAWFTELDNPLNAVLEKCPWAT